MAHPSWGQPCKGNFKTLVRSDGLKLPLRLEILELVALLIDETERRGYDVKPGQTWGNSCRKIRGSNSWSNHAWGLAIDINAPSNPMTNRLVTDMPGWMPDLWNKYGFRWGGDYRGRKDAMHYEFMGSVADAKAQTEKARRELNKDHDTVVVPVFPKDEMRIKPEELLAEFDRAIHNWPFIEQVELKYNLPQFLLFALGSRETNLRNIKSASGSDIGVWQRNKINGHPVGYMEDVRAQAEWSAAYLEKTIHKYGLLGGVNAYNSGKPETSTTTGQNYGPDVLARREFLVTYRGNEEEMARYMFSVGDADPTLNGIWLMGEDEVARHIPSIPDVEALHKLGVRDIGTVSGAWLLRHKRIHPELGNLPKEPSRLPKKIKEAVKG